MSRVRITSPVDGVPGSVLYEALDAAGVPVPGPTVAIVAVIHGNEPVGIGAHACLAELAPEHLVAGKVLAVEGNIVARALNLRHTEDGEDLNRLWDGDNLERIAAMPEGMGNVEEERVRVVAPLLKRADAILDLHSTSRPAPPFLLFRDDQRHAQVACRLGVQHLVTGLHEAGVLDGGLASNVGMRAGEFHTRLGFTFEAGEHTDPANAARAWKVVVRLLQVLEVWDTPWEDPGIEPSVYEVIERFRQTGNGEDDPGWRFVGFEGGEPGGGRSGPPRHLASFETIEADEVIVRRGSNDVVRAQTPFTMLMPAPTADPGTDLYYVAQRRHGGLGVHRAPRTDDQARREAHAIERMLDLLEDDSFERGQTLASFDSRMTFDLCADQIAHAIRLPEGHPHRRITVVGRGDWGGDETERRAGARYRQAMRLAVVEGLPIERVQLMRGASVGWLDTLTGSGMRGLFAERESSSPDAGQVRFFLSAMQPHTVSVLLIGDAELALREGDARHARVVLVVEAATVEARAGGTRTRTVRAGIVSSRRDLLRSTLRLVESLKSEHRQLLSRPVLAADSQFRELFDDDGGIRATTDPVMLAAMRQGVRRLQGELWRQALVADARHSQTLDSEADLSAWMAATMARTGMRDPQALQRTLVPLEDGGWLVDPDSVLEAVHVEPLRMNAPRERETPPQPLRARDISADTIERWIGWRRYLRGTQVVPDTRGKDVDLAFTTEAIQGKLASAFRSAVESARQMPGRVMVVVAGDGFSPNRERSRGATELLLAHRDVLVDERLRYLRIQHGQGTHLAWLRDTLDLLSARGEGSAPFGLQWEVEHGGSVNVVLVCVQSPETSASTNWTLDGWEIEQCAVVLTDLEAGARDYQLGLFTELLAGPEGRINQDLIHFGRAHCEGLLRQGGDRAFGLDVAALEHRVVEQLADWVAAVRTWVADPMVNTPEPGTERVRWVAEQLGLADHRLARVLAVQADRGGESEEVADLLWRSVPPWPGRLWDSVR